MSNIFKDRYSDFREADFTEFEQLLKGERHIWINTLDRLELFNKHLQDRAKTFMEAELEKLSQESKSAFNKLIEARFFSTNSEIRFFRNGEGRVMRLTFMHMTKSETEVNGSNIERDYDWTEERQTVTKRKSFDDVNTVQLLVRKYFVYDESGQAQLMDTVLYDCEVL